MRILQVAKYYSPSHGGMERVVRELSEGLAQAGETVRVVAASCGASPSVSLNNGVVIHRLKTWGTFLSQPLISGLEREIEEFRPDVIHFHAPNPLALEVGWSRKIPKVVTLHAEPDGLKKYVHHALLRRRLRSAERIIFSSDEMARESVRQNLVHDLTRALVIPFGFRFNYLQALGREEENDLLLFVGRLVKYKGLETLIEAMKRVRGRLAIVGDGPSRKSLEMMVNRFGLEDRIRFLGALPDSDLAEWYEACAVYVQPSISSAEAFGISMMEAMHFGKPVISTDLSTGVQSVNRHLVSGLVVKRANSLALSSAINSLLRDSRLRHDLGQGALARVKLFTPERMIQSHLDLYRSLLPMQDEPRALATDIRQESLLADADLGRDSELSR